MEYAYFIARCNRFESTYYLNAINISILSLGTIMNLLFYQIPGFISGMLATYDVSIPYSVIIQSTISDLKIRINRFAKDFMVINANRFKISNFIFLRLWLHFHSCKCLLFGVAQRNPNLCQALSCNLRSNVRQDHLQHIFSMIRD